MWVITKVESITKSMSCSFPPQNFEPITFGPAQNGSGNSGLTRAGPAGGTALLLRGHCAPGRGCSPPARDGSGLSASQREVHGDGGIDFDRLAVEYVRLVLPLPHGIEGRLRKHRMPADHLQVF